MSEAEQVQVAPPQAASSILDLADAPVDKPAALPQSQAPMAGKDWFLMEGLKGSGDKPGWLKDRYKSVEAQAQAYVELEKKIGEAAPEQYDFSHLGEGVKDDPMLQHFSKTFKEMNLSQKNVERVLAEFNEVQGSLAKNNFEAEMKKLGPQAKETVNQVNNWIGNTFDKETADTIRSWVVSADDVKALEALRAFQPRSAIPTAGDLNRAEAYESAAEVKSEMQTNWKRYNDELNYRSSVQRRLSDAVTRESNKRR